MERLIYAVYARIYTELYKVLEYFEKKCLDYEPKFWRYLERKSER